MVAVFHIVIVKVYKMLVVSYFLVKKYHLQLNVFIVLIKNVVDVLEYYIYMYNVYFDDGLYYKMNLVF